MNMESASKAATVHHNSIGGPVERDQNLVLLADRAVAAGLTGSWGRFKDPATGELEGPYSLSIDIPSGHRARRIYLHEGEGEALASFKFEQWIVLGGYHAILDVDAQVIIADVHLNGRTSVDKIPGAITRSLEECRSSEAHPEGISEIKSAANLASLDNTCAIITAPNGSLSIELHSHCPPEIAALRGKRTIYGSGLIIRGVTTGRHDEALDQLLDLSTSFFIDLDVAYGLTASLAKAYDPELTARDGYDRDRPNASIPRFPSLRYDRDAAHLYLYARNLIQIPLLEYLAYYQVIEFYLPKYTRAETIVRLGNILKDPGFDHSNDLALARLLDAIAPSGRKILNEREQVATTVRRCIDDSTITAFLEDMPAAAKALADKNRIHNVQTVAVENRQKPLTDQAAERIYDLRCRIVHGKDDYGKATSPIRPFESESRLMRHDLNLIRFIAQRVLIASSHPASW
jgi:hypothetical protein